MEWRNGNPILLSDIADIKVQPNNVSSTSIQNGNPAFAVYFNKENDANALATLEAVKTRVSSLNSTLLAKNNLIMEQSFDASVFIYRAINLVTSNLAIGVLLAVGVLWLFLRQIRATITVATSIPICLLSTAIILLITGSSLNVISLAGLAFSVGMVLDAAIEKTTTALVVYDYTEQHFER
ncbi:efflux RND transporter permease subunit (plasmid) [Alteromonas marina]|uniref:efflux RND transporter permease subunit n=1 Tax=unclassified Alteromonas TaxID=2614992 RepID=UPI0012E6D165|nr:efflux RND transporter permease subunit [Alteromonas sp. KUL150]GFD86897.1 hypothetical protein KUL150_29560 [Alteromonas sp. KUL150]